MRSGEKDRLKSALRERLAECGWTEDVTRHARGPTLPPLPFPGGPSRSFLRVSVLHCVSQGSLRPEELIGVPITALQTLSWPLAHNA